MLVDGGALVVYDVQFRTEMAGVDAFAEWMRKHALRGIRRVPKNEQPDLATAGFNPFWAETLRRDVPMTLEELTDYLMTHRERIAAVRDG